ncbi:MAG: hypothetical protein LBM23_03075 [Propionibacteriaceae bacterium]|nr:hypothetical protein [Propionibacteriaceae bacterium]
MNELEVLLNGRVVGSTVQDHSQQIMVVPRKLTLDDLYGSAPPSSLTPASTNEMEPVERALVEDDIRIKREYNELW